MGLVWFALVLSTLVVFHEWGHFYTARRFGIGVERFSIGFGPVLFRWRSKQTEFCLSLIPLGGYVKLEGEESKGAKGGPREFSSRPAYQRFLVIFAGPFLNAVLAFLIFSGIYMVGQPALTPTVGQVMSGYPAEAAGLQEGDRIVRVNGENIKLWEDLLVSLQDSGDQEVRLGFERDGKEHEITLTPQVQEVKTLTGKRQRVGKIGIMPSGEVISIKTSFTKSLYLGFKKVVDLTILIVASLWGLITGAITFKESMTGPIGIYFLTEQAARVGFLYLMYFTASLSVSLFVLNLLPIPVLDGGHLFFIVIESVIRRPIPERIKEICAQIGLYLLLSLIAIVIYQDLIRYGILDKIKDFIQHAIF
jgi:regulator of sigma E protease